NTCKDKFLLLGAICFQLSPKLLSVLERLGCFCLRSTLASICLMRSRVIAYCAPISSSACPLLTPMPKRMRRIRPSRGVTAVQRRDLVKGSIGSRRTALGVIELSFLDHALVRLTVALDPVLDLSVTARKLAYHFVVAPCRVSMWK